MSTIKATPPLQLVLFLTPQQDYQLSLEKGPVGTRLFGPDFVGTSRPVRASTITESTAKHIREALDEEFPPSKAVYVITRQENQYDQFGEYFCALFTHQPSVEDLVHLFKGDEARARHVLLGGGRLGFEDTWWNLRIVESGQDVDLQTP